LLPPFLLNVCSEINKVVSFDPDNSIIEIDDEIKVQPGAEEMGTGGVCHG